MGFFDNIKNKIEQDAKNELQSVLLDGENIESFYMVKEDYCALTNKRLIFVDKSFTSSKKATTGVPYNRINSVSLKKGGAFSISKEVVVQVGSKSLEIDLYDATQALEIFKLISNKIV